MLDSSKWFYYQGGVFAPIDQNCSPDKYKVDHAVLVVGYTNKYWIIKNSWGDKWGEKGYIRLGRGITSCNIACWTAFPKNVAQIPLDNFEFCAQLTSYCKSNPFVQRNYF